MAETEKAVGMLIKARDTLAEASKVLAETKQEIEEYKSKYIWDVLKNGKTED